MKRVSESFLLFVALLPSPHLSVLPREEQLTWAKQAGDPVLATHDLLGEQAHSPRRRRASPCPPPAGVFLDPTTEVSMVKTAPSEVRSFFHTTSVSRQEAF